MKVLILTPTALPTVTGNAVTAERWRGSLTELGVDVRVLPTAGLTAKELARVIDEERPRLVHAHHLIKSGSLLLEDPAARRVGSFPLVVSPAGTDINSQGGEGVLSAEALKVCEAARLIVTQSPWLRDLLYTEIPGLHERIVHVPKAFKWFGNDTFDLRSVFHWESNDVIFFCPAGIRQVKNNFACLEWMERVHHERPGVRVVFAGPPLEGDYADRFRREVERCVYFARWVEEIPPGAMKSAYGSADIVLNCSLSEGLSNTLLEAIASGKPLLVSRIPGNQRLLDEEGGEIPCGLLFDLKDPCDFIEKAVMLVDGVELRGHLAQGCREKARNLPAPEDEAKALLQVYLRAVGCWP